MKLLQRLLNGSGTLTVAFRITLIYAILGVLWIAFSDQLLITLFDPRTVSDYAQLQTYKGWFFILLTATILFFLILRNIQRLKRSEDLRYQTERTYRTIFENTGTATAILNADLTISLVNEKFSQLCGYAKHDIQGKKNWTDFFEEKDVKKIIGYHTKQRRENNGAPLNYEARLQNARGEVRHILVNVAPIGGTDQTITSVLDITDKKELEIKYLRAQRMESIGTLSGGIAHDLNNILAPIMLSVESLQKTVRDEKARRMLQIIKTSAERGSGLVNQILTFSRGAHGEYITVQPQYIIREISQIIRATFPKSIKLELDIPKDVWHICGNPTQIHQAVLNICVNARDAMPVGGTLRIEVQNRTIKPKEIPGLPELEAGPYVCITISDTGSGIPNAIRDKLFSPFFTTKKEGEGTGLGLATVDYIMRSHNGAVTVSSEEGHGSTFTLYFPATLTQQAEQKPNETVPPMGKGERLLVIDDEAAVCEMLSEILRSYNYEVIIARDGAEGIAKYVEYKDSIDLVLTDSNMPYIGGEELIRTLAEVNPSVKIFITTASEGIQERLKHLQPPIVGFLTKPYTSHSLLLTLHQLLRH